MKVVLAITVDVDNDGMSTADVRDDLRWRSVEAVPALAEIFQKHRLPATWFIRADDHIAATYGHPAHLLNAHAGLWRGLEASGHEIGWHPHLYRREAGGRFRPDYDGPSCRRQLHATHEALRAAGWGFRAVRVGEGFGSNAVAAAIGDLPIGADCTALPGRVKQDAERAIDWEGSPNWPYHPSRANYRLPVQAGWEPLPFLEVPMTTVPIQVAYDAVPVPRYVNLAFRPEVLGPAVEANLEQLAAAGESVAWLTPVLHPDETFPRPEPHPLYAFALSAVDTNLERVLGFIARRGWPVLATTIRGVIGLSAAELRRAA